MSAANERRSLLGALTFVEASAGTGKTHHLSSTVIELVALDEVTIDQIAVVTFTRAAATEIKERIRRRLGECRRTLLGVDNDDTDRSVLPHALSDAWDRADAPGRAGIVERIVAAHSDVERATVTTIHGFCQQILATLPMNAAGGHDDGFADDVGDVIRSSAIDLIAARVVGDDPWPPGIVDKLKLTRVVEGATFAVNNHEVTVLPTADDAEATEIDLCHAELITAVADEVERRLERSGRIGHHHLLTRTRDAVASDASVVDDLRSRYRIALIDEFQDTDALQWSIFSTLFDTGGDHGLVCVGDPKQAIYSFRGGDIGTYLDARSRAEDSNVHRLSSNYRSDPSMVAAFNDLFSSVTFGGEVGADSIRHEPVACAPGHESMSITRAGTPLPPLVVRVAAHPDLERTKGGTVESAAANRAIFADLAQQVSLLIDGTVDILGADAVERTLGPGGVAVLCRSKNDCLLVHRELARLGIPSLITGAWSVTDTAAPTIIRDLLWALASPGNGGRLRRVALGPLVGARPHELVGDDVSRIESLHESLIQVNQVLAGGGVAAAFGTLRRELDLPATVMARHDGERDLIDIEHVVELLAAETDGRGTSPSECLAALVDLEERASKGGDRDDLFRRRTPSDGDSVQIMTVHGSKGLEFDVVLCPSLHRSSAPRSPVTYAVQTTDGHRSRVFDLRSTAKDAPKGKGVPKACVELATDQQRDEDRRLAYVAITRARHQCIAWFPGTGAAPASSLGAVLGLDQRADDDPLPPFDDDIVDALAIRFAGRLDTEGDPGLVRIEAIGKVRPGAAALHPAPTGNVSATPDLRVASFDRTLNRRDGRWSFSRVTSQPALSDHDHAIDVGDPSDDTLGERSNSDEGPLVALPLADVGKGTEFGTLVHETFERADLSAADLRSEISRSLIAVGGPGVDDERHAPLVDGLVSAAVTPLGPLFGGLSLAGIAPEDHLDEMDFEFTLPTAAHSVAASTLASLIGEHQPAGDPLGPWAEMLARSSTDIDLGGFMVGSIDGLFRVRDESGTPRFVVVDYKTNWLGRPGQPLQLNDYAPANLPAAMAAHHYPLQALIYAVATHRFLRWRLADYDPTIHLGGSAYLFLRGMIGAETPHVDGHPHGVASWTIPPELVIDASNLLSDLGASPT